MYLSDKRTLLLSLVVKEMSSYCLKCLASGERTPVNHADPSGGSKAGVWMPPGAGGFRGWAQEWQTASLPRNSTGSAFPHTAKNTAGKVISLVLF